MRTATAGPLELRAAVDVEVQDSALVIDLAAYRQVVEIELNGRQLSASSPAELAVALRRQRHTDGNRLMSIPYDVAVDQTRVIIDLDESTVGSMRGAHLVGSDAQAAVDKALRVAQSVTEAWPRALEFSAGVDVMQRWSSGAKWDGPLVVSMPRTGSTLMGILFLFCRDEASPSGYLFDRYVHEPVAPLFWRGDNLSEISRFLGRPLSPRDVVQESAYQFVDPAVARWFLKQARGPVIFMMRHPQIAWPSRWRAMLAQTLADDPATPLAGAARRAIDGDDYTGLFEYLTESVTPADNGFYAFLSLLGECIRLDIDFVIVDNTRMRENPDRTLEELCRRLGIDSDHAMSEWSDLEAVTPRIVMSELALGAEYRWYYERTLQSHRGIEPETRPLVAAENFPDRLRGVSDEYLTIEEAVTWHQLLLARPETLP